MNLPPPIARLFRRRAARSDAEPSPRPSQPTPSSRDEGQTHPGRAGDPDWWQAAKAKYRHVAEPLDVTERTGRRPSSRASVTGDFPGSPADADLRLRARRRADPRSGDRLMDGFLTLEGKRALITSGTRARARRRWRSSASSAPGPDDGPTRPDDLPEDLFVAADLTTAQAAPPSPRPCRNGWAGSTSSSTCSAAPPPRPAASRRFGRCEWAKELDLNLLPGRAARSRAACPAMVAQGSGVVIHVTSIQSRLPLPEATTAYAAAKAALSTYSKSLSKEVSPKGVRVVRVSPGWIETEASVRLAERLAHDAGTDYDGRQGDHHGLARRHPDRPALHSRRRSRT